MGGCRKWGHNSHSYSGRLLVSRTWSIERHHFQWPWRLGWPLTQISRSPHYLTVNVSEMVRDTDIVTMELTHSYSRVSFQMTWSDFEWFSKIFNDTKHHKVCLQHLSFLLKLGSIGHQMSCFFSRSHAAMILL